MFKLFNTLSRSVEDFTPLNPPKVGLYACGPTVYDYTHIGHLRKYTGDDVLIRTLKANGFEVKHVMNITDVGHLTSDEDEGDDKLEKGAKERNESVWEVAEYFTDYFFNATSQLNISLPDVTSKATDHIGEQIKLIEKLEKNGFTYTTDQAVYFDTSRLEDYGKLTGQKLEEKNVGVRDEVVVDTQKKNPQDFALWFFTVGHFQDHVMRWPSPWGEGFPGWHIECSAMGMEYLGDSLDIHTGGIDHIPVHHTNEIAQSEAATGKPFVKYWVHHNFLQIDGGKMSKSLRNFYTIEDIKDKGFDALALRYLFLTAHYRDSLNFTWESLQSAQNALGNLRERAGVYELGVKGGKNNPSTPQHLNSLTDKSDFFYQKFLDALNNDLNTSQALAVMWDMVKSGLPDAEKGVTLLKMDEVLGLGLGEYVGKKIEVPEEVKKLLEKRENARSQKDFPRSDQLRDEIKKLGYEVLDTPEGQKIKTS
jgi:cysteinyl-tRNA synthetase